MNKSERITKFVGELMPAAGATHYEAYFHCFNQGDYYEAHDVLEQLWLSEPGHLYFKALIQVAGAFVHMKKQFIAPDHPKHGRRLRPAVRLLRLGTCNLKPFVPKHMRLDVRALCELCLEWADMIEASDFTVNPWNPEAKPQLKITA